MQAAKKGDLRVVKRLLASGVDANAGDANGYTPLQYAVGSGNVKLVRALLAAGADVNARAADGYTALHAAAVDREVNIVELLLASGVTPLMCSVGSPYGDAKVSLALIRAGADVNAADLNGEAAFWIAATSSPLEVVEEMLKKGADPNVRYPRSTGNTPLHMAAMNGLKDEVELLLRYGADPTIRNANGETPADVTNPKLPVIKEILSKASQQG
jgi:ankyrin repeat protein